MPRRQRAFRTQALILKRRDFGEADRLLTVLSPEYGKLDVIAKGARKPTSTKTGHVELFTQADMLIHSGRDLGIATQAEMVAPFMALREDLQRGAYASYAAELLDRFTTPGEGEAKALFELLAETFERLCNEPDPRLAVRYYEIRLLDLAGFRPELQQCVLGRESIQAEDQFFSFAAGGVVCPRHGQPEHSLIAMPTLKLLRHMQRSPYEQVAQLQLSPALHASAEQNMLGYITFLLEKRLQSIDFIHRIRR